MSNLPYRQVHLDFHTPELPFVLGKNFDKKIFQQTLQNARINSVTLTGRCHHGHIYYETKLPARHPQMTGDFLMAQVDACHEIGIRAPIYLTVGWDAYAAERHPEWLERKVDGSLYGFGDFGQLSPGWKTLCFNTAYRTYLNEQIVDTMRHFQGKLDGLFFDILWQDTCYCNACNQKMLEKGYDLFCTEDRQKLAKETEQALKHQIYQTVQQMDPQCPIFFNEGNILPSIRPNLQEYAHLEIESLPSGEWGYQHFPTAVRYAKNLGKEYVGMTGKFHKVWSDFGSYKNQAALEYECFLALAHGARCSIGDQMYPDGRLQLATYELIGSVYQRVEKLETYNQQTTAVADIAILHTGLVAETTEKVDLSLAGAVNMLNEAHHQFVIVDQAMDWSSYRLLLLPDKITLTPEVAEKLEAYRANGGKIIASYHSGLMENQYFPESWGIDYQKENEFVPTYGKYDGTLFPELPQGELVLHGASTNVLPAEAEVIGEEFQPLYVRHYPQYYAHFQAPIGEKTAYPTVTTTHEVTYFSHAIFEMYKYHGVKQYKELVLAAIDELLDGKRLLESTAPTTADIVLNHKKNANQLILNVLHYVPKRTAVALDTIEDVIPLYAVEISLNLVEISKLVDAAVTTIQSVKIVSNGETVTYTCKEGMLKFVIPKIDGYQLAVIDYQ